MDTTIASLLATARFQMVARLGEKAGELASAVNYFEDTGAKRQKHGGPHHSALAGEVRDAKRTALSITRYHGIEQEWCASIDVAHDRLQPG